MSRKSRRQLVCLPLQSLLVLLLLLISLVSAVKHHDFKTCEQSGVCSRNRKYGDDIASAGRQNSPFRLDPNSIKAKDGQFLGTILKSLPSGEKVKLPLIVTFLDSGKARIRIDEERRQNKDIELRHNSQARKERYNEAGKWALTGAGLQAQKLGKFDKKDKDLTVSWGSSGQYTAVITYSPFAVDFYANSTKHVSLNDRGFMNWEQWRPKIDKPTADENSTAPATTEDESTWWDETFGGNTDSKPKGPESIALDATFPGVQHVYGLAEHTGPLSLRTTRGGDDAFTQPYRFWNADVFEYELNSPMTLYGSIPFLTAHTATHTTGLFWLNPSETWVDIVKTSPSILHPSQETSTQTHWFSEAGVMDIFVIMSASPAELSSTYAELTGTTALPQSFSLGYHQCRWNYVSDTDVKTVDRAMDKHNIPYDVIWLDLEYTDDKQYFTWDQTTFPDPVGMEVQLDDHDRQLVIIIDPHIKNKAGYKIVDELKSKNLAVKNKDNNIFEGWCWPGSSHWIDAFNPAAKSWWQSLFPYKTMSGVSPNVHIWNDMNEPSVFNGPEVSMPRDNLHYDNFEHRDVHNLNGLTFHEATYAALLSRSPEESKSGGRRPFVLTRSFFAGSQRTAAMWTGDNQASWSHLKESIPMILSMGASGFPFAGADVGGFFGNPSKELLTRWYQAGIFYPFMRGHAHIDTRRREPYLAGPPYTGIITQALRLRYQLLPTWYTAFHTASRLGSPIIRAQFYIHPSDPKGFTLDDQFYIGGTGLLAKPITDEDATSTDIYLSGSETYYDYFTYKTYHAPGASVRVEAPLDTIPLLMQGGHIFPRKDRPRRSSGLMRYDPYTLVVVLSQDGRADGELYVDDGDSFHYRDGAYIHRRFAFTNNQLSSSKLGSGGKKEKEYLKTMEGVTVEKVIIVNAPSSWHGVEEATVSGQGARKKSAGLEYHAAQDGKAAWAVVRNPAVRIGEDWDITFTGSEGGAKNEL